MSRRRPEGYCFARAGEVVSLERTTPLSGPAGARRSGRGWRWAWKALALRNFRPGFHVFRGSTETAQPLFVLLTI